ncbi:hypothetical protein [Tissierella praeacuta]|nr:hypothetical protein [Tissierella praeacuta]
MIVIYYIKGRKVDNIFGKSLAKVRGGYKMRYPLFQTKEKS